MAIRTTFPSLVRLSEVVPIPFFKRAAASGARLGQYAAQSVERYKTLIAANPDNPKPTLFTNVFNAGKNRLSDFEIRLEASGYIIAGSDTTAITLTYLVWAVCRDRKVQEKLVAELASLPEQLRDSDARDLPYLSQVVHETLRLYPAVPSALPRAVPQEGATLAGYQLPGGTTVSTQAYSLHRDPTVFVDPDRQVATHQQIDHLFGLPANFQRFDPERWVNPTKEMKAAFMPFGGGSRSKCLH